MINFKKKAASGSSQFSKYEASLPYMQTDISSVSENPPAAGTATFTLFDITPDTTTLSIRVYYNEQPVILGSVTFPEESTPAYVTSLLYNDINERSGQTGVTCTSLMGTLYLTDAESLYNGLDLNVQFDGSGEYTATPFTSTPGSWSIALQDVSAEVYALNFSRIFINGKDFFASDFTVEKSEGDVNLTIPFSSVIGSDSPAQGDTINVGYDSLSVTHNLDTTEPIVFMFSESTPGTGPYQGMRRDISTEGNLAISGTLTNNSIFLSPVSYFKAKLTILKPL